MKPPVCFTADSQRNWPCNIAKCQDLEGNLISEGGGNNKPNQKNKIANIYIENVSGNITLYTQWHKSHACIYYSEQVLTKVPNTHHSWASL